MSGRDQPTYLLEVSKEQLQVLSAASELLARLGMGQVEDALERLPLRPPADRDNARWHEDVREIRQRVAAHTIRGVDGGRFLSIHSKDVSDSARTAWDLYQVMRNSLAWDRAAAEGVIQPGEGRKWPQMLSTHFDAPLPVSGKALAKVTLRAEQESPAAERE